LLKSGLVCGVSMTKLVSRVISFYAIFLITWFLANQFIQDSWWGLVVLDKFAEYFVLPAGLFLVLSFFTKSKTTIAVAVIPVLIFLYFYGSFFYPITSRDGAGEGQYLRVATFNIWNHNQDLEQVATAVISTEADVIALQEITEAQEKDLIAGLKSQYPYYHISKPIFGGTTAIVSRYPLGDVKEIDIGIDRPSIIANIVWEDNPVTLISAHLNPSFWAYWRQPWKKIPGNYLQYIRDQNQQVLAIQSELAQRGRAKTAILACDCNSQEAASTNRLLRKTFKDAFRSIGWQLGSTNSPHLSFEQNLMHIDYIWYSGNAVPIAVYRGAQTAGSDHEPVIADFKIRIRMSRP